MPAPETLLEHQITGLGPVWPTILSASDHISASLTDLRSFMPSWGQVLDYQDSMPVRHSKVRAALAVSRLRRQNVGGLMFVSGTE